MTVHVDADALLCALVLAPRTFSRNRFFSLFTQAEAKHARARAAELRAIVRHLSGHRGVRATVREVGADNGGFMRLRYDVPGIRLERTAILDALELALVRFALWRIAGDPAPGRLGVTKDDRSLVQRAISKLDVRLRPDTGDGVERRSD
jgi:hypothetical protein